MDTCALASLLILTPPPPLSPPSPAGRQDGNLNGDDVSFTNRRIGGTKPRAVYSIITPVRTCTPAQHMSLVVESSKRPCTKRRKARGTENLVPETRWRWLWKHRRSTCAKRGTLVERKMPARARSYLIGANLSVARDQ